MPEYATKFTPGPWKSVPVGVRTHWADITDSRGQVVAQSMNVHGTALEIGNAHLISAAPDLYEACKEIKRFCDSVNGEDEVLVAINRSGFADVLNPLFAACISAVSKAHGE